MVERKFIADLAAPPVIFLRSHAPGAVDIHPHRIAHPRGYSPRAVSSPRFDAGLGNGSP